MIYWWAKQLAENDVVTVCETLENLKTHTCKHTASISVPCEFRSLDISTKNRLNPADNTESYVETWLVYLERQSETAVPPRNKPRRKDSLHNLCKRLYVSLIITLSCRCLWPTWKPTRNISASLLLGCTTWGRLWHNMKFHQITDVKSVIFTRTLSS